MPINPKPIKHFVQRIVYGWVYDGVNPVKNAHVKFILNKEEVGFTVDTVMTQRPILAPTDEDGYFEQALWCDEDSEVPIDWRAFYPTADNQTEPPDKAKPKDFSLTIGDGSPISIGTAMKLGVGTPPDQQTLILQAVYAYILTLIANGIISAPVTTDPTVIEDSPNAVSGGATYAALALKQDALNFTPERTQYKKNNFDSLNAQFYPNVPAVANKIADALYQFGTIIYGGVSTEGNSLKKLDDKIAGKLSNESGLSILSRTVINGETKDDQTLFVCPTGKQAIIFSVAAHSSSVDTGQEDELVLSVVNDGDFAGLPVAYIFDRYRLAQTVSTTDYFVVRGDQDFKCRFNGGKTNGTLTIDVIGYLMDAPNVGSSDTGGGGVEPPDNGGDDV